MHILCFAPYTNWSIHSAREVTILQALRQRGCSVSYIACDAAYPTCDMLQPATGAVVPPGVDPCLICQSSVAARLAAWAMPYRWLGRWQRPEDDAAVERWVAALSAADYPTATFARAAEGRPDAEVWELGAWVNSSVRSHLRHNVLDLDDPEVAGVYAQYLRVGLRTALGLSRLFAAERPAAQLLFNGRMAPTRVALEIGRQRGVRALVEERASIDGRVTLYENAHCFDLSGFHALWSQWKDIPLGPDEVDAAARFFADRWRGRSRDVGAFSKSSEDSARVYQRLTLDRRRPVWVLFTSSLDEAIDESRSLDAFPSQAAWIDATLMILRQYPDAQLVIRVHPNVGSRRSLGRNSQDAALYARLAEALPDNVRLVPSDDETSSYTLVEIAALGLVWHSTIGLEMAATGKPVVRVGSGWLEVCDGLYGIGQAEDYVTTIRTALTASAADRQQRVVQAWRFAYTWFYRFPLPFPFVRQTAWYIGEPVYQSMEDLAPGRDESLDRICAALIDGSPLHPAVPRNLTSSADDEKNAIDEGIALLRDPA